MEHGSLNSADERLGSLDALIVFEWMKWKGYLILHMVGCALNARQVISYANDGQRLTCRCVELNILSGFSFASYEFCKSIYPIVRFCCRISFTKAFELLYTLIKYRRHHQAFRLA